MKRLRTGTGGMRYASDASDACQLLTCQPRSAGTCRACFSTFGLNAAGAAREHWNLLVLLQSLAASTAGQI